MAYSDPSSVIINGTTFTLARVPSPDVQKIGQFSGDDGNIRLTVHQQGSKTRCRREARLTMQKVVADPISAVNKAESASVIIGFDEPKFGFTDTELTNLFTGLAYFLTSNSSLNSTKLLNGEL